HGDFERADRDRRLVLAQRHDPPFAAVERSNRDDVAELELAANGRARFRGLVRLGERVDRRAFLGGALFDPPAGLAYRGLDPLGAGGAQLADGLLDLAA